MLYFAAKSLACPPVGDMTARISASATDCRASAWIVEMNCEPMSPTPIFSSMPESSVLHAVRGRVPTHRAATEVGPVGHVAGQRGVVTEYGILHHGFASAHRL